MSQENLTQAEILTSRISKEYLAAILISDTASASKIIFAGLAQGISIFDIYIKVICQAQKMLGVLWLKSQISITQEHLATQVSTAIISTLRQQVTPKAPLGFKVLVATPNSEPHIFPAQVVSDFFYFDGWEIFFPGNNIPEQDLVEFVKQNKIDIVCLSVSIKPGNKFQSFLANLKKLSPKPKIMLGGAASELFSADKHIDAIVSSIDEATKVARSLLGKEAQESSLNQYLKSLGERIYIKRKSRSLNQQKLAELAGLDRAYLSSVENGKQNISLAAVNRIAQALGLTIEELLEK